MPEIAKLTAQNFDSEVAGGVVLVDFSAEWCGPCKMMKPIVDELAAELEGKAKVVAVDVDEAADVAARFGIASVPTFIIFREGSAVKTLVGYMPKEGLAEAVGNALPA